MDIGTESHRSAEGQSEKQAKQQAGMQRLWPYRPGDTTSRSIERRDGGTCHHLPISHQMDMLELNSEVDPIG